MTPRGMRGSEVRLRPARGALSCGCADGRRRVAADAGRISLRSATAATWPRSSACRFCALRRPRLSLAQPSVPSRRRALARGGSSSRRLLPDRTHPRGARRHRVGGRGCGKDQEDGATDAGVGAQFTAPRQISHRCRQPSKRSVCPRRPAGRPEGAIRRRHCRGGGYRHRV